MIIEFAHPACKREVGEMKDLAAASGRARRAGSTADLIGGAAAREARGPTDEPPAAGVAKASRRQWGHWVPLRYSMCEAACGGASPAKSLSKGTRRRPLPRLASAEGDRRPRSGARPGACPSAGGD